MNATYTNPILKGDYSDPDVIRVGEDYYMISSSFRHTSGNSGTALQGSGALGAYRICGAVSSVCRI